MGEACGTYGGEQTYIQGFGGATRRKDATWRNYYRKLDDNIKVDLKYCVSGLEVYKNTCLFFNT